MDQVAARAGRIFVKRGYYDFPPSVANCLFWPASESLGRTQSIGIVYPRHNQLGRPGLEPGTNPENFRGCSVNLWTSTLRVRAADSFFVLEYVQLCVLRPSMAVPSPRQVRWDLQTYALCDCCRACAPRFGVQDSQSRRCNSDDRRARCIPKA